MLIEELKKIIPEEAEVYSVTPNARYVIMQKRGKITRREAEDIVNRLRTLSISACVIVAEELPRIFEFKDAPVAQLDESESLLSSRSGVQVPPGAP